MKNAEFFIITFPSTNYALKAERTLTRQGFDIKTVPVPRNISSDCGIALKVKMEDIEKIKETFTRERLEKQGIYEL